jgi:hypothetical protein
MLQPPFAIGIHAGVGVEARPNMRSNVCDVISVVTAFMVD